MSIEISQKVWAEMVNALLLKLCLRKSDLAKLLGESRFYIAHILAGRVKITASRRVTYASVIPFLKHVLLVDGVFKKGVYEPGRNAAERRHVYVSKLKLRFEIFLKTVFEKENENVARSVEE